MGVELLKGRPVLITTLDDRAPALTVHASNRGTSMVAGSGRPCGPPQAPPILSSAGAGTLAGMYQYAYTEHDANGETTLSPVATYVANGETVQVRLPLPRRGMSGRIIYRTTAGGNIFRRVSSTQARVSGGSAYFQTVFADNTQDDDLTDTRAPKTDSTAMFNLQVRDGVKYFRTSTAQGSQAADLTMLTAEPNVGGAFSIDSYGQIMARVKVGNCYQAERTAPGSGDGGRAYKATFIASTSLQDVGSVVTPTEVFYVDAPGNTVIQPASDKVPLTVRGAGTSDLIQGRDSTNTLAFRVQRSGQVTINPAQDMIAFQVVRRADSSPVFQVNTASASVTIPAQKISFFGAPAASQPTAGPSTAGASYGATERVMLQTVYSAMRTLGLMS